MRKEITVKEKKLPDEESFKEMLEWVCECLGLIKGRDIEKTSAKLLLCILKHSIKNGPVKPEVLAQEVKLSRSTVVHHLQKYIRVGMIVRTQGGYELRERTLEGTIREIERDIEKEFERIRRIARKIDEELRRL